MIAEDSSSGSIDLKTRLYQIITEKRISALSMLSDMVASDEEQTKALLEELVEEGALEGSFTHDGNRFFLSDVKVSSAPTALTKGKGFTIKKVETRNGKLVLSSGLVMMITGYLMRGLIAFNAMFENAGVSFITTGLVILIVGGLMITRADPPSNIK